MSATTTDRRVAPLPAAAHHLPPRLVGAALALGVAYVHVRDQGGFPGSKEPGYVGIGYYLLEATAVVLSLGLLAGARRHSVKVWALAVGVALGPLVGFVLSRGPGLPGYSDDRGNWTEPLALVSIAVEVSLLALTLGVLARSRRPGSQRR